MGKFVSFFHAPRTFLRPTLGAVTPSSDFKQQTILMLRRPPDETIDPHSHCCEQY